MGASRCSVPLRSLRTSLSFAAAGLVVGSGYGVLLLLAGSARRRRPAAESPPQDSGRRFLVIIPAHDEEEMIAGTLDALSATHYPSSLVRTAVIADNCTDRTAEVAAGAGAEVRSRRDSTRLGKGQALLWGLNELRTERADADAVVFLDADCQPSINFLAALDAALARGAQAAQVGYVVANPEASWAAALRWAAFALLHLVRPRGRAALGLSCGIFGTGFCLTKETLDRHPWQSTGLAEDQEYHLELVAAGVTVEFVEEAFVSSTMPTSLRRSREQNLRWEGGRRELVRRWTPRLVMRGMLERDPVRVIAAVEPLLPPQSLQAIGTAGVAVAAIAAQAPLAVRLAAVSAASQVVYVLGGMRAAGAPADVYRALGLALPLAVWKTSLQLRVLARGGPHEWVGTREVERAGH